MPRTGPLRVENEYDFRSLDFVDVLWSVEAGRPGRAGGPAAGSRARAEGEGESTSRSSRSCPGRGRGLAERPLRAREGRALGEGGARGGLGAAPSAGRPPGRAVSRSSDAPGRARRVGTGPHRHAGAGFSRRRRPRAGALESFRYEGRELVASPLAPNFWRAPLDNDIGFRAQRHAARLAVWKNAGPQRRLRSVTAEHSRPGWCASPPRRRCPPPTPLRHDLDRLRQRRRGRRGPLHARQESSRSCPASACRWRCPRSSRR